MKLIDADRLKEVFRRNTGHDYSELIDIQPTVDVLNKIRAEISDFEEEVFQRPNTDYSDYAAVRHCLEIIDNHRGDADEVS